MGLQICWQNQIDLPVGSSFHGNSERWFSNVCKDTNAILVHNAWNYLKGILFAGGDGCQSAAVPE